jgi:hypothetical protein
VLIPISIESSFRHAFVMTTACTLGPAFKLSHAELHIGLHGAVTFSLVAAYWTQFDVLEPLMPKSLHAPGIAGTGCGKWVRAGSPVSFRAPFWLPI